MACWVLRLDRKSPPFHLALAYFWTLYHTMPKNARARKKEGTPISFILRVGGDAHIAPLGSITGR